MYVPTTPGIVVDFAGSTAPDGWLMCDGSAVSRTTYAALFAAIGTTWGVGDGATTFNLPPSAGLTTVGAGSGYVLGATGGEATHILTTNEMPSHTHTQNAHTHTQNAHGHTTQNAGTHSHSYTDPTIGSFAGLSHDADGTAVEYPTVNGGTTSTVSDHSHTVNNTTATNQNATATNQNTGGGAAHNNLQPYGVFNRIIKY